MSYTHAEAFRLMKYVDTAGKVEWIWNSRDGVTPFIVQSRQGLEAKHTDWGQDPFMRDYWPTIGERIFVDLTRQLAQERATAYVEKWWDDPEMPMREHPLFTDKEQATAYFAEQWYGDGVRPALVEVTLEVLRRLRRQGYVYGYGPMRAG